VGNPEVYPETGLWEALNPVPGEPTKVNPLYAVANLLIYYRLKRSRFLDPFLSWHTSPAASHPCGGAISYTVSRVHRIFQNSVHRPVQPLPTEMGASSLVDITSGTEATLPCNAIEKIERTRSTSSIGPVTNTTRSVFRLFCSPRSKICLGVPSADNINLR